MSESGLKIDYEKLDRLASFIEALTEKIVDVQDMKLELGDVSYAMYGRGQALFVADIIRHYYDYEGMGGFSSLVDALAELISSRISVVDTLLGFLSLAEDEETLKEVAVEWAKEKELSFVDEKQAMGMFLAELVLSTLERLLESYQRRYRKRYPHIDNMYREMRESDERCIIERYLDYLKCDKEAREKLISELSNVPDGLVFEDDDVPF